MSGSSICLLSPRRGGTPWRSRGDGPVRPVAQALLDDADRLAAFLHPHHEAVVAIAAGADGNVEVHAVVHVIGLAFADIPGDARTADHRAGKAPFDRVFL